MIEITDNALRRYLGLDEWNEADHPRDDRGRFTDSVQGKINSVKIDFTRDNILPELNEEDLAELGKESKPVLVSKRMLDRNRKEHPELSEKEYNFMIAKALYDPDYVFPANPEKTSYYHFISNIGDKYNSGVILELSDNKENYETVHVHKLRNKSLRMLLKRKKD